MNKACAGALIAACAVAVTLFAVRTPPTAEGQVVVKGPQWEYKVVAWGSVAANAPNADERDAEKISRYFTGLAEDGWEYIRDLNPGGYSVFKRAKR
jgi:hypothetical protein